MTVLRDELEAGAEQRRFGSGWLSGAWAFVLAVISLGTVICLRYPDVFASPDARDLYRSLPIRGLLLLVILAAFSLAAISLALRKNKVLGTVAMALVLLASILGGPRATERFEIDTDLYFGLDFFLINLIFLGLVFVPIERIWGRREQLIFRDDWREDLLYFLISSLLVQGLTYLSLAPSMAVLKHTEGASFRDVVGSQPLVLQFFEIMFLTDVVQYLVHRVFHSVPRLWRFHAIHHSAPVMDWLAGSRMHLVEVVCLRAATVMPMSVLGFSPPALYAYIIVVYFWSAMVHSNVRQDFGWLEYVIVTPRFHHWHHGLEREAINVNFAVHFPILDMIGGTFYLPENRWPSGYGVLHPEIPRGYLRQAIFPFGAMKPRTAEPAATASQPSDTNRDNA